MATLVFTAVGQTLGGPMGAALGSILGRSIDESLFGPGPRRGPRLGDLSVQTSSYGSMIPRLYGTMRVAGTVIWSTDLIEEETVEGGGKGAPASQGYKYSVSLAVSLSSRPVKAVRRIWADGKLIRGIDGDLKVKTDFRLLAGDEDQAVDPLIASVETIAKAPAYRGQALAIFEGLELGEFGNRIPQLTFEVLADDEPVSVQQIVSDNCVIEGGLPGDALVMGYAAYGESKREAVATLVELAGALTFDDGERLHLVDEGEPRSVDPDELGCSAGDEHPPRLERDRRLDGKLGALSLTFYDPGRDYQAGQVRAVAGEGGERDERKELPAAMDVAAAKALAERLMVERQQGGDRLIVRLPPQYIDLSPGAILLIPHLGGWQVRSVVVEGMAVEAELRRPVKAVANLPADGGRAQKEPDVAVGRSSIILFELPLGTGAAGPVVAVGNDGLWRPVPVEIDINGVAISAISVSREATIGLAIDALAAAQCAIVDRINSVTVELSDHRQRLFNADAGGIAAGTNLALLGEELIQFHEAADLGAGRWQLRGLVRGCLGTDWAAALHMVGDRFCLLGTGVTPIGLDGLQIGASISVTAHGIADVAPFPHVLATYQAEHLRPLSPCRLAASVAGSNLSISWTGRSWDGFGWSNHVDPPALPVRIGVENGGSSFELEASSSPALIPLSNVPGAGTRTVTVSACSIAGSHLSRPALINIII